MTREKILEIRRRLRRARYARYTRFFTLYALVAEAFFLPLSPPIATIALLIGIVALFLRRRYEDGFRFRALPFDLPAGLFILLAGASVLVSPDSAFSFYNYYNLVGAFALTYFLAGQGIRTTRELRTVLCGALIALCGSLAVGYWQFLFGIDTSQMKWVDGDAFPELKKRIFSTWENPNIFAGYLDMMICLAFGFLMKARSRAKRIALAVLTVLLLGGLTLTYARGALLVLALILVVYGILRDLRILLACALIGAALLLLDPMLYTRLTSVFTQVDTSMEMRMAFIESTLQMIQDHPFLGIGWGAYFMVYPQYDFYLQGASVLIVHAHNIYLNYMAEIGIPGAFAFFWLLFGSLIRLVRLSFAEEKIPDPYGGSGRERHPVIRELQKAQPPSRLSALTDWSDAELLSSLRLGFTLLLISVALNGLTDDLLFNIPTSMLLWLVLGLIGSMSYMDERIAFAPAETTALSAEKQEKAPLTAKVENKEKEAPKTENAKNASEKKDRNGRKEGRARKKTGAKGTRPAREGDRTTGAEESRARRQKGKTTGQKKTAKKNAAERRLQRNEARRKALAQKSNAQKTKKNAPKVMARGERPRIDIPGPFKIDETPGKPKAGQESQETAVQIENPARNAGKQEGKSKGPRKKRRFPFLKKKNEKVEHEKSEEPGSLPWEKKAGDDSLVRPWEKGDS